MSIYQIIYLSLLVLSLLVSVFSYKENKSLYIFPLLLTLSLGTEILVSIFYYLLDINYNVVYHIYIPIEYALLAYFFYLNIRHKKIRWFILISIPLYITISFFLSLAVVSFYEHPGLNFNVEGLLLILWSLATLFTIEPKHAVSIEKLPIFWVSLGILIFHPGIFFFNGVYNYLQKENSALADHLHLLTIKTLNYVMYLCFIIGFICSNQMKKYILP